jgi:hypothetical protein
MKKFDLITFLQDHVSKITNIEYLLESKIKKDTKYNNIDYIKFSLPNKTDFGTIEKVKYNNFYLNKIFIDHKINNVKSENLYESTNSYDGPRIAKEDLTLYITKGMGYISLGKEKRPIIHGESLFIPKNSLFSIEIDNLRRGYSENFKTSITLIEESFFENPSEHYSGEFKSKLYLPFNPIPDFKRYIIKWSKLYEENDFPKVMKDSPMVSLGTSLKDKIEPYYAPIKEIFDNFKINNQNSDAVILSQYKNMPYKIKLLKQELLRPIIKNIINTLDIQVDKNEFEMIFNSAQCMRNLPTDIQEVDDSDPDKFEDFLFNKDLALAERLHFDTSHPNVYRIGIYLNDIDQNNSPLTYVKNPENNYLNFYTEIKNLKGSPEEQELEAINIDKRYFNYGFINYKIPEEFLVKLTGPAFTTFLFAPNFLHKGGYARTSYRDIIYLIIHTKKRKKEF